MTLYPGAPHPVVIKCRIQHFATTACTDSAASAVGDKCKHAIAVESATRPIPGATAVFASNSDLKLVLPGVVEKRRCSVETTGKRGSTSLKPRPPSTVRGWYKLRILFGLSVEMGIACSGQLWGGGCTSTSRPGGQIGAREKSRSRSTPSVVYKVWCRNFL